LKNLIFIAGIYALADSGLDLWAWVVAGAWVFQLATSAISMFIAVARNDLDALAKLAEKHSGIIHINVRQEPRAGG